MYEWQFDLFRISVTFSFDLISLPIQCDVQGHTLWPTVSPAKACEKVALTRETTSTATLVEFDRRAQRRRITTGACDGDIDGLTRLTVRNTRSRIEASLVAQLNDKILHDTGRGDLMTLAMCKAADASRSHAGQSSVARFFEQLRNDAWDTKRHHRHAYATMKFSLGLGDDLLPGEGEGFRHGTIKQVQRLSPFVERIGCARECNTRRCQLPR